MAPRAWPSVLVAVVLAVVLSGFGWTPGPPTTLSESAKLQQQAQAALTRWADAVAAAGGGQSVVLVGDLTAQAGDWEPAVGDNNKRALMAGLVEAAVSMPAATGGDGTVTWQDGTTTAVHVVSAEQAVAKIQANGPAKDCPDLRSAPDHDRTADAIAFVSPSEGWGLGVPGDARAVLRSKDGGVSWGPIAELPWPVEAFAGGAFELTFADDAHGWAATASGHLLATADGGRT